MRKRSMLVTLMICMLVSLCALVACGNTSKPKHSHKYIEVDEVASTCVTPGTKAHYKCEGCDKLFVKDGDKYVETTADELALPLAAHTFNGISVKTNPTKTVYTAFEEFDLTGIEVVKTCSVTGCNGEAVNAGDVTFAYAKDGADKLTADMTKVVIKAAGYETDFAVTVNKIEVQLPTAKSKAYTGSPLTADVAASDLYAVTENNGGTNVGKYDVKLTLTDPVNYAFAGVEGAVATLEFEITKADNEITMPGSIADINCCGEPTIGATAKDGATVTYVYSTAEDGEYGDKPEGGFVAGTYYVKAVAADTANLNGVTSPAMSFNVAHKLNGWNTENAETDTGVCVCGAALRDYTFNKVITDKRQDVLLESSENRLTLGGISDYKAVKSVKYGELSFGDNKDALVIPEGVNDVAHGEQYLTVVVTDNYDLDHTIQVPVTLVTKSITNFTDLVNCVYYKIQGEDKYEGIEDKFNAGKYFILANDFNATSTYGADGMHWANAGRGFAGTLDGRYHTITGGEMYGGGLFGSIESGTVKNIKFADVKAVGENRVLIAGTLFNATLENVEIYITDKKVCESGQFFGILASHPVNNVTLTNVKIDAAGSTFPWIGGHHPTNNADPAKWHCDNVEIIADSVGCFASGNEGKLYLDQVDGLTYKLSGSIDTTKDSGVESIDPKQFGDSFEWTYTFAEPWTRYASLKSVTVNGVDMTDAADLLDNTLVFYDLTQFVTEDMYNKAVTFVVEFAVKEGSSVKVALTVNVLDVNEQKTFNKAQDVILRDSTGEKTSFTLDLGEDPDLAGGTITGATFNEEKLTVENGAITIPDSMKNGAHGANVMTVFATKGSAKYTITVPITIVTESISNITRLLELVKIPTDTIKPGKIQEGKYFILAGNIEAGETRYNTTINYTDASGNAQTNFSNIGINEGGFAGTLDGRGFSVKGGVMQAGGIFGALDRATIKDINFLNVSLWEANSTLLAGSAYYSTIENVNITIAGTADTITNPSYFFGVIASYRSSQLTLTKVNITAENATLNKVFGSGWDCTASQYTCDKVVVKAKDVECLAVDSHNNNAKITEIPGVTVIKTATAEA